MDAETTVRPPAGPVVGTRRAGTTCFLGIPFALPPVGQRRFRAPQARPRWKEPFEADRFGDSPLQEPSPYFPGLRISEDCLSLNVWVPDGAADAPVLLWVYGGGFAGGTSAVPIFDGARFSAESGAVVVSANHRTGILGFASLAHRGLPEASNLGVRDVAAALRWVQDNIASFGGDPAKVTVMGQSSGAFIAAALLAVPDARASIDKLVLISGGASRIIPQQQAERLGDQVLAAAGVASGPELLELPAETLLAAQRQVGSREIGARNAPVPDSLGVVLDYGVADNVLIAHPLDVLRAGEAARIPVLFVVTGAEMASLRGPDSEFIPSSDEAIVDEIAGWGAADAARIAAEYGDGDLGVKRESVLTDYIYRLPAARAALAQNSAGGRAWLAQVDQTDGSPASHDLPTRILFGNLSDADPLAPLSKRVRAAVADFVTRGGAGWRPFDREDAEVMHFGRGSDPLPGDFAAMLRRWEGVARP